MKAKSSTPAPHQVPIANGSAHKDWFFRASRHCLQVRPCDTLNITEAILLAAGSEVHLALAAQEILATQKISARVVSMPCWELFDKRNIAGQRCLQQYARGWRSKLEPRWHARYIGLDGEVVGLDRFGASVPQAVLYREFGIPAEAVADTARRVLFRAKGIATQHSWEQPKHSASN